MADAFLLSPGPQRKPRPDRRKHPKEYNTRSALYRVWRAMRNRCYLENTRNFKDYGGRGISVCDQWRNNYQDFMLWSVSSGYSPDLTLDRIDNSKGYSPENCRWADRETQNNNKRNNAYLTAFGETKTAAQWARDPRCNVPLADTLLERVEWGWTHEDAISRPLRHASYTAFGETRRISEWLEDPRLAHGVTRAGLKARVRGGWSHEDAITTPSPAKSGPKPKNLRAFP